MKNLFLLIAVLCLSMIAVHAEQLESVVVNPSTFTVSGNDYVWGANPLVISSSTRRTLIKEVDISVSTLGWPQTVTLWDGWTNGTSSATVKRIWEVVIPSGTASGQSVYSKTFIDGNRGYLKADNGLAITKSSTGNNVTVSLQYE